MAQQVFRDKSFLLIGRLHEGKQDSFVSRIETAGGTVTKDVAKADYVVVDKIGAAQQRKVDSLVKRGACLVSSPWIVKSIDKGLLDETTVPISQPVGSVDIPSSSVAQPGAKRVRADDIETDKGLGTSVTDTSQKRPRTYTPPVQATLDPSVFETDVGNSYELFVDLDDYYCGSHVDEVLIEDCVWDATLTQTDIDKNINKFYNIQLTHSDSQYFCFSRWGRVGTRGHVKLQAFEKKEDAVATFKKKSKDKTKCRFEHRAEECVKDGAYCWIQKEYCKRALTGNGLPGSNKASRVIRCQLSPSVQSLLKLIMDVDVMKRQIVAMGINIDQLPLGKLTKKQIHKGFLILSDILLAIEVGSDNQKFTDLSNKFYSLIPHKIFGKHPPPIICKEENVKHKLSLLQSLEDLRLGTDLIMSAQGQSNTEPVPRHRLDVQYEQLNCDIINIPETSQEYLNIQRYIEETHNEIQDRDYNIKMLDVYSLSPRTLGFEKFAGEANRRMLWHSSRLGNFAGIISRGLRIAPKEAPRSGYRLGKGIYFSDSLVKSSVYCWPSDIPSTQCLLLCEVALGIPKPRYADDTGAHLVVYDCNSTWAVGRRQNDLSGHIELAEGLIMPTGKEIRPESAKKSMFQHNEFVVYDPDRVRPRYLVTARFEQIL